MIKILHIASFNGNIGDNANHNGFRGYLEKALGDEVTYTELEMREFYKSWQLRSFNSVEFINLCNAHDMVIFGGGNFFELKWDYSSTGTTIDITCETLDQIKTPILFNGIGCDIGKGTSDSNVKKYSDFLTYVSKSDRIYLTFRNDGSHKTVQSLYGSQFDPYYSVVPDGGFFVEVDCVDSPLCREGHRVIGVNIVSDMKDVRFNPEASNGISYDAFVDSFSHLLDELLKEDETLQLLFFPHIYSDLLPIYQVISKLSDPIIRKRVTVAPYLTGTGSERTFFGLYQRCDLILGMRFHSNVCAIATQRPLVALGSYKKIGDVFEEIGLGDLVIPVNQSGYDLKLKAMIEKTLEEPQIVVKRLQQVIETLSIKEEAYAAKVSDWFKQMR